jgi:hypothetical protein
MCPAQLSRWLPALLMLFVLPAGAAEWLIEPKISLRGGYNVRNRTKPL